MLKFDTIIVINCSSEKVIQMEHDKFRDLNKLSSVGHVESNGTYNKKIFSFIKLAKSWSSYRYSLCKIESDS